MLGHRKRRAATPLLWHNFQTPNLSCRQLYVIIILNFLGLNKILTHIVGKARLELATYGPNKVTTFYQLIYFPIH